MACLFHLALLHVLTLLALTGAAGLPAAWCLSKILKPIQREFHTD